MRFEIAPDIQELLNNIVEVLKDEFPHVSSSNIVCMRSYGSKANAYARIWSLPKIWQKALGVEAHYIIEVISHHFDNRPREAKVKTLIHELLHIPSTFSGALRPHKYSDKTIEKEVKRIMKKIEIH